MSSRGKCSLCQPLSRRWNYLSTKRRFNSGYAENSRQQLHLPNLEVREKDPEIRCSTAFKKIMYWMKRWIFVRIKENCISFLFLFLFLETCVVDEHSYNLGDGFVSADCSGYCKCHPGGSVFCVSLCPPEGITCQHNEDAIQLSRKIPNSNCTCPTWRCLRKSQQGKKKDI